MCGGRLGEKDRPCVVGDWEREREGPCVVGDWERDHVWCLSGRESMCGDWE